MNAQIQVSDTMQHKRTEYVLWRALDKGVYCMDYKQDLAL